MPSIEFITEKHNGALTRIDFENESKISTTFKSRKLLLKWDYPGYKSTAQNRLPYSAFFLWSKYSLP